jgi:hypothetical protein
MGVYDSILLSCPKCGELYAAQSKSGDCLLRIYNFEDTPDDVMANVNRHAPFVCFKCGAKFKVEFDPKPKIVETGDINDDFPRELNDASPDAFAKAFENYQSKIDKK